MSSYPMQQDGGGQLIANPLRIFLRAFGALMLVAGLAIAGVFVALGPFDMADAMGKSCSRTEPGGIDRTAESCDVLDVIELVLAAPVLIIVGLVLVFTMTKKFVQADPPRAAPTPLSGLGARTITPFDPSRDADAAKQAQELLAEWERTVSAHSRR